MAHTSTESGTISLGGNVFTHGKNLTVRADAGIQLGTPSTSATFSTRQIGTGSNSYKGVGNRE